MRISFVSELCTPLSSTTFIWVGYGARPTRARDSSSSCITSSFVIYILNGSHKWTVIYHVSQTYGFVSLLFTARIVLWLCILWCLTMYLRISVYVYMNEHRYLYTRGGTWFLYVNHTFVQLPKYLFADRRRALWLVQTPMGFAKTVLQRCGVIHLTRFTLHWTDTVR